MHNGAVFVSRKRPLLNSGTTTIIRPYFLLGSEFLSDAPRYLPDIDFASIPAAQAPYLASKFQPGGIVRADGEVEPVSCGGSKIGTQSSTLNGNMN